MYNIGDLGEQNMLKLVLFRQKHNVLIKQLTVADIFVKSDLDTGILK
jgi:hypothetical protein